MESAASMIHLIAGVSKARRSEKYENVQNKKEIGRESITGEPDQVNKVRGVIVGICGSFSMNKNGNVSRLNIQRTM